MIGERCQAIPREVEGEQYPSRQNDQIGLKTLQHHFTYCEAGFNSRAWGDVIITVTRDRTMEMMEDVPL